MILASVLHFNNQIQSHTYLFPHPLDSPSVLDSGLLLLQYTARSARKDLKQIVKQTCTLCNSLFYKIKQKMITKKVPKTNLSVQWVCACNNVVSYFYINLRVTFLFSFFFHFQITS